MGRSDEMGSVFWFFAVVHALSFPGASRVFPAGKWTTMRDLVLLCNRKTRFGQWARLVSRKFKSSDRP